jgi:mannose-6-phosphate isomerase-like protein (cupin superfamily)
LADKTIDMGDYQVLADMRMPECSIRILRLSRGKAVNLHVHRKTIQVYFVIEGDAVATVAGEDKKLGPMKSLRVPIDTPHALSTESTAIALSISIPPLRLDDQIMV